MENLITYLVRCVLVSALLTCYYAAALRGRRMHGFNRFYLLSSVVVALVLPVLRVGWAPWDWAVWRWAPLQWALWRWTPWAASGGGTVQRVVVGMHTGAAAGGPAFWWRLVLGVCLLVSGILLLVTMVKIGRIYRLKRVSHCTPMDGYELVETSAPGTPFSFFSNLFWRSGMDREGGVNGKILAHELAHIRGRHSWDIVAMQAVLCLFWMNPFFWYIRRELNLVLEFTADAAAGTEGHPELLAQMLLQAYQGGCQPQFANSLFHSPIKRRLVMITNNQRVRRAWMRKALVLPVIVTAVVFFACRKDQAPSRVDTFKADVADAAKIRMDSLSREYVLSGKFKLALKGRDLTRFSADSIKIVLKKALDSATGIYQVDRVNFTKE